MDDRLAVNKQLANEDDAFRQEYAHKVFNRQLAALRAQLPFIPIVPFPNQSRSYKLTANSALDIDLPNGTKFIMLSGDGVYYITRNGKATVPTSITDDGSGCVMNPEYAFLYVEEISHLSAISESAIHLTVHCFSQL